MYQGLYHGTKKHEPDLDDVMERGWSVGLEKIIVTGGGFKDSKKGIEIAKTDGN